MGRGTSWAGQLHAAFQLFAGEDGLEWRGPISTPEAWLVAHFLAFLLLANI